MTTLELRFIRMLKKDAHAANTFFQRNVSDRNISYLLVSVSVAKEPVITSGVGRDQHIYLVDTQSTLCKQVPSVNVVEKRTLLSRQLVL